MRISSLIVAAAAAIALSGCGQKGPLVLPDAQRPHKKIGLPKAPAHPPAAPASPMPTPNAAPPDAVPGGTP